VAEVQQGDAQAEGVQRHPEHLRLLEVLQAPPLPGMDQVIANSSLHTARSAPALLCVGLGLRAIDQHGDTVLRVVLGLLVTAAVNHVLDVVDGD